MYANKLQINLERCSGCGRCVASCPQGILTLQVNGFRKHAYVTDMNLCTLCGKCVAACPLEIIELTNCMESIEK
ncbi:MAG: 4Fe-4S binding protein [Trichlorobacter sp.]|nr:4Fe-4S binding protein [Trichlorobacter sp.]